MPEAPGPSVPPPLPSPRGLPDLSRLRIPRDRRGGRAYRGFPWVTVLVLLLLAGVAWLFRAPLVGLVEEVAAPALKTTVAERVVPGQAAEGDVAANGYVVANRQASVATVLSGRLVELHAQEGDLVDENAILARIQYDDLEAQAAAAAEQVNVAEAQVAEAEAAIAAARLEIPRLEAALEEAGNQVAEATVTRARLGRDVERSRPLFERGVVDQATQDRVESDARAAAEALAAAQARARGATAARAAWDGRIRQLEASLVVARASVAAARRSEEVAGILVEKTRIRAPFPGLVVRKDAELGEVIAPTGAGNSRGSVFTIVDPASLEVQVELSEKRILKVAEGDAATVFLDADPEKGLPATVRKIWPRADRSKGTIEVRVAFDARPAGLRPEMAARVVFRGKASAEVVGSPYVAVPPSAVVRRGGADVVFVVEGDVARMRAVKAGRVEGGRRAIAEGLEGGETLVLSPPAGLADGARVRTEARP